MNKHKDKPLRFLIIDDDTPYVESLNRDAQRLRIFFTHRTNLEEARQFMESKEAGKISAIVLDVKCMMRKQQEVAHSNFIMEAVIYFRKAFPHLPMAILTGEPDEYKHLKELFMNRMDVYFKGSEEEQMLLSLSGQAQRIDYVRLEQQHPGIFEAIAKYLEPDAYNRLLTCLQNMRNTDCTAITGTLGNLRKLQEYLYMALNRIDNDMVPDSLVYYNGKINIDNKNIIKYLKGNYDQTQRTTTTTEYVKHDSKEDRLLNYIYKGCSEEIHVTDQNTTKYTVQSLVFAFMDLVLWLKEIADRHAGSV